MKYADEFRDPALARALAGAIARAVDPARDYALMEFCGGHTHAIFRYGVQDLVPANVRFVHGPGCPVCILPACCLDDAIELAEHHRVILCTYGDVMRVPASRRHSLMRARAHGADVRMVYSTLDALRIARENPGRPVVFLGIGFETTAPASAAAILAAETEGLGNFSLLCHHVQTPPVVRHVLAGAGAGADADAPRLDGLLGPSHVSVVVGVRAYQALAHDYAMPVVIAGFEPLDVLQSVLMLVHQINAGQARVDNQYHRAVADTGNLRAQAMVARVFSAQEDAPWRGLGTVPASGLAIREAYAAFDARRRFALSPKQSQEVKHCICPAVLRGAKRPVDCRLFGRACTPETPMGACMVSSEGACAAWYAYRRDVGAQVAV